jgi:peptidyl-prolyl cis-trans isomerase B (cyclophilin B)
MQRTLSHGIDIQASRPARAILALALALALAPGCGGEPSEAETDDAAAAEDFAWPTGPSPRVTLHIADRGDIVIELYPQLAPGTVENFLTLARSGFYDGTTFHRVMPGFMIQGGDPASRDEDPANDGQGNADYKIDDEINSAPHLRGVVAMANTGRPNTASCQFFIVHADSTQLDGGYTIFGRVVDGLDVVDVIAAVETDRFGRWGSPNRPLENVVISGMTISDAGATASALGEATPAS